MSAICGTTRASATRAAALTLSRLRPTSTFARYGRDSCARWASCSWVRPRASRSALIVAPTRMSSSFDEETLGELVLMYESV